MDLLLRVDGTPRTGAGHVMRCLALASAVRGQGGTATFVGSFVPEIACRLRENGMQVVEAAGDGPHAFVAQVQRLGSELGGRPWVVLDGYDFDVSMQRAVRAAGYRLLVIDDCGGRTAYDADIILNQNIHAPRLVYQSNADAMRLLGSKYVLLRPEFIETSSRPRSVPPLASNVLVSFGAADPAGLTARLATILQGLPEIEPSFVVGPAASTSLPRGDGDRRVHHAPRDMRALMEPSDLAIVAAGSTVWELAYLGVPMIVFVVAENQRPVAAALADAGLAVNLGDPAQVSDADVLVEVRALSRDQHRRRQMSERGRLLIDGAGVERTVAALRARSSNDHD